MSVRHKGFIAVLFSSVLLLALTCFLVVADALPFYEAFLHNATTARQETALPPVSPVEAIVVVTGDSRRIPRALALLAERSSPLLVISGVQPGVTLHQMLGASAVLPKELLARIVVETEAVSTRDNARRTRPLLQKRHVKRVILVTSDYHMYRTLRAFESIAKEFEYVPFPVASETGDLFIREGVFSSEAFPRVANEFVKLIFYKYVWRFRD